MASNHADRVDSYPRTDSVLLKSIPPAAAHPNGGSARFSCVSNVARMSTCSAHAKIRPCTKCSLSPMAALPIVSRHETWPARAKHVTQASAGPNFIVGYRVQPQLQLAHQIRRGSSSRGQERRVPQCTPFAWIISAMSGRVSLNHLHIRLLSGACALPPRPSTLSLRFAANHKLVANLVTQHAP